MKANSKRLTVCDSTGEILTASLSLIEEYKERRDQRLNARKSFTGRDAVSYLNDRGIIYNRRFSKNGVTYYYYE